MRTAPSRFSTSNLENAGTWSTAYVKSLKPGMAGFVKPPHKVLHEPRIGRCKGCRGVGAWRTRTLRCRSLEEGAVTNKMTRSMTPEDHETTVPEPARAPGDFIRAIIDE